ncbi:MAG TPA: dihydrodipicolinate reductase [Ruminiclostridium sp.]|nr:dihydrodipicolinate reductase [Ruminiclostridium sp.]
MKLKIGLFGFGRAGSAVAKEILNDKECSLMWVMRRTDKYEGSYASHLFGLERDEGKIVSLVHTDLERFFEENPVDVIIDFSASCAVAEYQYAVKYGTRIVSAISNYDGKDLERLKELSRKTKVLYSPNISIGINFLIEASKVLQKIAPQADIEIIEEHFRDKKDVSGTALRIAQDLCLDTKKHVNSIRVGGIVGKHEVVFGLPNQTIRIIHESINRSAFGEGAIFAAKWLMEQEENGLYTMEKAMSLSITNGNGFKGQK